MELKLIELMFYTFTAIIGVLFIYITVIAVLFIRHIRSENDIKNQSDSKVGL